MDTFPQVFQKKKSLFKKNYAKMGKFTGNTMTSLNVPLRDIFTQRFPVLYLDIYKFLALINSEILIQTIFFLYIHYLFYSNVACSANTWQLGHLYYNTMLSLSILFIYVSYGFVVFMAYHRCWSGRLLVVAAGGRRDPKNLEGLLGDL